MFPVDRNLNNVSNSNDTFFISGQFRRIDFNQFLPNSEGPLPGTTSKGSLAF